jgi:hypothetical protein
MNASPTLTPPGAHDLLSPADWTQAPSSADTDQLRALVHALLVQRCHVILSAEPGSEPTRLEHGSRWLMQYLRGQHGVKLLHYMPGGTQQLVERLNTQLADMSVSDAVEAKNGSGELVRVFVIHDTTALSDAELHLLAQLTQDFPGTQLRVLLIMDEHSSIDKRLRALGRRAMHVALSSGAGAAAASPRDDAPVPSESRPAARRTGRWWKVPLGLLAFSAGLLALWVNQAPILQALGLEPLPPEWTLLPPSEWWQSIPLEWREALAPLLSSLPLP